VTVFGESAGAGSIQLLYFNSGLQKLVRGAVSLESLVSQNGNRSYYPTQILQSGFDIIGKIGLIGPREPSEGLWKTLVARVPTCNTSTADTFACLRQAEPQQLLKAAEDPTAAVSLFRPVIDGPRGLIPDIPSKLWDQGKFSKIPFISGTNLDEGE
jgi:acetylcholinesterase